MNILELTGVAEAYGAVSRWLYKSWIFNSHEEFDPMRKQFFSFGP